MRIHRPKLKMPHPFAVLALAMIWPLCAIVLTAATVPANESDVNSVSKGVVAMQQVEVQADKLWRKVTAVPQRIRASLHDEKV